MSLAANQPSVPLLVSETRKPKSQPWAHHWERGVDPWHPDAYRHTPLARFLIDTAEPRKSGWYGCTKQGSIVGFVADGAPVHPEINSDAIGSIQTHA